MKVFIVYKADYDSNEQHGIFSSAEKANAYIALVAKAEAEAGVRPMLLSVLSVSEDELDELDGATVTFVAYSADEESSVGIYYHKDFPEQTAFVEPNNPQWVYEAYGRTPAEARANYKRATAAPAS